MGVSVKVIQHVGCETLGMIAQVLAQQSVAAEHIRPFKREIIPTEMGRSAGLIIMGGPMGVYEQERYPFLRQEIRLIEGALKEKKPVLGICLGSQLLATVLGAGVTKGKQKEIGWRRVALTEAAATDALWSGIDSSFTAYHWHGDVFNLPQSASLLASSDLTPCQAFRYGVNAYGFLFHAEVTRKIIQAMVDAFADELREAGINGEEIFRKADDYLPGLQTIGATVFRRWTTLLHRSG